MTSQYPETIHLFLHNTYDSDFLSLIYVSFYVLLYLCKLENPVVVEASNWLA